jgi:hypothetical protein
MRILSVDVGIKHLAHCLLDSTPESTTIIDWDVLDLTEQWCSCGEKATSQLNTIPLCKRHSTHTQRGLIDCIALCTRARIPLGTVEQMRKQLTKHTKKPDVPSAYELGKSMKLQYDKLGPIDLLLIENQIGPLASKMKMVQGMVIQYWIMKGAVVECISACNKLKLFVTGKTTYAERKKLSIQHALSVLSLNDLTTDVFQRHKKKDDLADTFLQAVWYLHTNCGRLKIKSY